MVVRKVPSDTHSMSRRLRVRKIEGFEPWETSSGGLALHAQRKDGVCPLHAIEDRNRRPCQFPVTDTPRAGGAAGKAKDEGGST